MLFVLIMSVLIYLDTFNNLLLCSIQHNLIFGNYKKCFVQKKCVDDNFLDKFYFGIYKIKLQEKDDGEKIWQNGYKAKVLKFLCGNIHDFHFCAFNSSN